MLTARLLDELAELTADLKRPAEHAAPAEQLPATTERMHAILSSDSRRGRWTVPAHLDARSVLGDCQIELHEAVLTSHVTTIDACATLGSITIHVPDGVEVRISGTAILGAKESRVTEAALPGAPVIHVRARAILGNVTVVPAMATGFLGMLTRRD